MKQKPQKNNHLLEQLVTLRQEKEAIETRLASFTDFNPRPIVEIDFEGKILYQNPQADLQFPDLRTKGLKHIYLSDIKRITALFKNGEKSFIREIKIKHIWWRQNIYYIPSFNLIRIFGLNITSNKVLQKQIKESSRRYYLLFEKMGYGYALQNIILNDKKKPVDYRFIDVNPAFEKLAKLKKEHILGKTANEISKNPKTKESIKLRKDYDNVALTGKPMYLETYNEPLKKHFQMYVYKPNKHQLALIFSDITARKKNDEEKNNFISIMSHELRNPLTPIMANAQFINSLLQNQKKVDPVIKESVDVIEKQSKMMADLLNDILDVSRLNRKKIQLHKKKIDLCQAIKGAIQTSLPFINTKNQHLSVFLPKKAIWLQADPVRIEQIMVNIINNASKYTQPGGNISITAATKNKKVKIIIKDNGMGMSKEKIDTIFELFSDESQSFMGIGGLGIGLNIVKNLVSMHKGTITVNSKGENKGSEFIIQLPFSKLSGKASKSNSVTTEKQTKKTLSRILIVDDNPDIRKVISKILQLQGHTIKSAHHGMEAITMAKTFKPDVALIDIGLPDINGYNVATILRKQHHNKKMKLIAFTGYGQQKDKELSKEAGFDHHVTKPIDINELLKIL